MNGAQLGLARAQMMQARTLERHMAAQSGLPLRKLTLSERQLIGSWDRKQERIAQQRAEAFRRMNELSAAHPGSVRLSEGGFVPEQSTAPHPLRDAPPRRRLTLWQRITGRI